ncbi:MULTISPECIES: hypothetical protein [unclassified Mesorhizobium]|uniref:hypothetical protein n=1 Tax=unclassified Mesorhizobium TaxID=325217 RepID=UPI000FCB5D1F|nr:MULTISPECIES: hypothetical protein [unclassified Mesorhizobium]TGP25148.1 hypothetical protein EN874_008555 [Mesorhizobium sp. M1D.F.Ca.ET.231.01.1.1]TGP36471.1 hypothetical protein EN877_08555 [Mesorhizobium sp. M1D.F.Ca.ET.234.01.1.1]TGS49975.1 hypothetical protein EN827_08555 [Mesorhizobium sp. M1D.F.Ca.ET.184.01.1.1]TGS64686.1 hypothetical protein EN826_008555 [Mesorhizobium sp. M1D.F.Ca.ET.183.01.1.1]
MSEFDFGGRRASEFRHRGFWALFAERHPEERARLARRGPWFWQRGMPEFALVLSMYVAPSENVVGVFFGRNEKLGATGVWSRLKPFQPAIEARLKLRPEQSAQNLGINSQWRVNCFAEDNWPAMADWLVTECSRFEQAVLAVLGDEDRP